MVDTPMAHRNADDEKDGEDGEDGEDGKDGTGSTHVHRTSIIGAGEMKGVNGKGITNEEEYKSVRNMVR